MEIPGPIAGLSIRARTGTLFASRASRKFRNLFSGDVVQSVRTLPCHGRGREFESRRPRHFSRERYVGLSYKRREFPSASSG